MSYLGHLDFQARKSWHLHNIDGNQSIHRLIMFNLRMNFWDRCRHHINIIVRTGPKNINLLYHRRGSPFFYNLHHLLARNLDCIRCKYQSSRNKGSRVDMFLSLSLSKLCTIFSHSYHQLLPSYRVGIK